MQYRYIDQETWKKDVAEAKPFFLKELYEKASPWTQVAFMSLSNFYLKYRFDEVKLRLYYDDWLGLMGSALSSPKYFCSERFVYSWSQLPPEDQLKILSFTGKKRAYTPLHLVSEEDFNTIVKIASYNQKMYNKVLRKVDKSGNLALFYRRSYTIQKALSLLEDPFHIKIILATWCRDKYPLVDFIIKSKDLRALRKSVKCKGDGASDLIRELDELIAIRQNIFAFKHAARVF
jgi:hypothetical protein